AEFLVASARDHEDRLKATVAQVQDGHYAGADSRAVVEPSTAIADANMAQTTAEPLLSRDLLRMLRDICGEAREQRQLAEAILMGLIGDVSRKNGKRVSVLVVDDSIDSRNLAADVVEASGF